MPVSIKQDDLKSAMQRLCHLVPRSPTLLVLESVLLRRVGEHLQATVTDLEVTGCVQIPCSPGSFVDGLLTDARSLRKIAVAMGTNKDLLLDPELEKESPVKLAVTGTETRTSFIVPATGADEFPAVPAVGPDHCDGRAVPADELLEALCGTSYAIHDGAVWERPNLRYLCVVPDGDGTAFIATDGHRLAVARVDRQIVGEEVLVPRAAVAGLQKMLVPGTGVHVCHDDKAISFASGDLLVAAKTGDEVFPDWRQVVATKFRGDFSVDAQELAECVKRVSALANRREVVRVRVEAAADSAVVTVDSDGVRATESLAAEVREPTTFVLQRDYILEAARHAGSGLLRIRPGVDAPSQVRISRDGDDDGPFTVVMEVRE